MFVPRSAQRGVRLTILISMSRTILGLVVSPLAVPVTAYIAMALAFPASGFAGGDTQFTGILVGFVSYVVCFVLGVPLHLALRRHSKHNYIIYAVTGVIAGSVSSALVFAFLPGLLGNVGDVFMVIAVLALAGFLVASSFWVIAVREPNPALNADAPKRRAG